MGNISSVAGGAQEVVRVVRQDGKVLEFYDDMPAEELMVVYPKYLVCQDQVLENGQVKRKFLSAKESLLKGQVYLLLLKPTPQQQQLLKGQALKQKQVSQMPAKAAIRSSERPARAKPVDVLAGGRVHSVPGVGEAAAPPGPKKIGLAARQAFPKEQINKFLEAGSVKIITKDGTARLSGPQLSRLLNEASSHGRFSSPRMMASPKPSSLSVGLESIPEEPQHLRAV